MNKKAILMVGFKKQCAVYGMVTPSGAIVDMVGE